MVETVKTQAALLAEMADGGNNTAEEIRNGIASMFPPATLEYKPTTDDPPDDEFNDEAGMSGATNGLDAKWTVVDGVSGTVGLLGATGGIYDLASRPGSLLVQAEAGDGVALRQDYTIPDGSSIVAKVHVPMFSDASAGGQATNDQNINLVLNTDDASPENGAAGARHSLRFVTDTTNSMIVVVFDAGNAVARFALNQPFTGPMLVRIARAGLVYTTFLSLGGKAWTPMTPITASAAYSNLWIYCRGDNALTTTPIVSWDWIRLGTNDVDPW